MPSGAGPSFIRFSADATTSHATTVRTIRELPRLVSSLSSRIEVIPTTPPPAVKTGPPTLPESSRRSNTITWAFMRVAAPDVMPFGSRSGTLMVKSSCPSCTGAGGFDASPHPSGTGRTDAMAFGSIHRIATSFEESDASTRAGTLSSGVICTSTDVAAPIIRWLVATRPFASITNPVARAAGVQRATTLFCHCGRRNDGSSCGVASTAGVAADVTGPISALRVLSSSTLSRPATMSRVCVHW